MSTDAFSIQMPDCPDIEEFKKFLEGLGYCPCFAPLMKNEIKPLQDTESLTESLKILRERRFDLIIRSLNVKKD